LLDPYVFVEVGMNARHFGPNDGGLTLPHSGIAIARAASGTVQASGDNTALTFDERIGYGLTHFMYAALDFELGNFGELDTTHPNQRDLVVDGLASLGLRGGLGPIALAVEISGGAMEYSYPTDRDVKVAGMLEARGHVDLWLAPWCTLGGLIGTSLIHDGDWMAGVYIGLHSWAFAGDR
jgi:hypothetical protein